MAGSQNPIQCVYCKGNYYSAPCEAVKTMEERRAILIRDGRCFVCLKHRHRAQNCESNKKCRKYNHKHHQSLCNKSANDPENTEATTGAEVSYNNTTNSVKDSKLYS